MLKIGHRGHALVITSVVWRCKEVGKETNKDLGEVKLSNFLPEEQSR